MVDICTWNSRGDPTADDGKLALLKNLQKSYSIILLQECGRLTNTDELGGWNYQWSEQAGAFNVRCSTAIISKIDWNESEVIYLSSGSGRCAIAAHFGDCSVATLHAYSGGVGMQDVKPLCQALAKKGSFVIGGDLNVDKSASPFGSKRNRTNIGSSSRSLEIKVAAPSLPTHSGGNRLDMFVCSGVSVKNVNRYHSKAGSDHYPVYGTLSA